MTVLLAKNSDVMPVWLINVMMPHQTV